VYIEPIIRDVDAANIEQLLTVDLMIDGTDNVETRYLMNDVSIKQGIPWIYGACVGAQGRVMTILPTKTACLRCVFPDPPKGNELETCDTAGVLGPAVGVVASIQALEAIKILSGNESAIAAQLLTLDLWNNRIQPMNLAEARNPNCPCCGRGRVEFLSGETSSATAKLCGRDAVQIRARNGARIDLDDLRRRLAQSGTITGNRFFVRAALIDPPGVTLTIFDDARAIISGTSDGARARSIYARFVGA
jgi:hypothetical protein